MKFVSTSSSLATNAFRGFLFGAAFAVVLHFAVWIFGPPRPTLDTNTQAYFYVLEGLKSGKYATAKDMFDWAYSSSNDPELRYVADYNSRSCELALKMGISTYEEAGSLEGDVKAFVDGFTRPMDGVSGWSQIFQKYMGDYQKNCSIIDERYHLRIREYWAAIQRQKNLYYFLLFAPPIISTLGFVMIARGQRKHPDSKRAYVVSTPLIVSATKDEKIVVPCKNCGQKLRIATPDSGVRLKCGTCQFEFHYQRE